MPDVVSSAIVKIYVYISAAAADAVVAVCSVSVNDVSLSAIGALNASAVAGGGVPLV